MDIDSFCQAEGITEYSIIRIKDLPVPDPSGPLHLVPGARSVIVFGSEIPVPYFGLPQGDKTRNMLRIEELLDRTAPRLVDRLVAENFRSDAVPLFLPVCVKSGQVQGIVRLKYVASCGGTRFDQEEYDSPVSKARSPARALWSCHRNGSR